MRAVVQRVTRASVTVEGKTVGAIETGMLVLLGVGRDDTPATAAQLAEKIVNLRIFEDSGGKMNRSLAETHGSMLVVSQFTLYADVNRGRRPGFERAAPPELAEAIYEEFVRCVRLHEIFVESGVFRADMQISLVNDGPVTILLDSEKRF